MIFSALKGHESLPDVATACEVLHQVGPSCCRFDYGDCEILDHDRLRSLQPALLAARLRLWQRTVWSTN
jgi:hypothetical protein